MKSKLPLQNRRILYLSLLLSASLIHPQPNRLRKMPRRRLPLQLRSLSAGLLSLGIGHLALLAQMAGQPAQGTALARLGQMDAL